MLRQTVVEELKDLINHLEANQIDYFISGSLAMNSYLVPRFTRDVDIVIDFKDQPAEKFLHYFDEHFYLDRVTVKKEIDRKGFFNILSTATGHKYDFIVHRDEEYENKKFERKQRLQIFNIPAWLISLEDLIISKFQWMQQTESAMQKNDISFLLEDTSPDLQYIRYWIKKLGLNTFGLIA